MNEAIPNRTQSGARQFTYKHLEVDKVGQEQKPRFGATTGAEAQDLGNVVSAEWRVGHENIVLWHLVVTDHLLSAKSARHRMEFPGFLFGGVERGARKGYLT